ncbi:KTSC domain-containing protein [Aliivibrio fischeri]|uniref:KTSC domain-containing protein n=1 Tax=Aliivibrio fischeri TaxID=668 RepID=UPI00080DBD38|nr:KTSC domain-containing protein [Aliivibrio fischeri]MUK31393.1 KTSC domain-containing protein [Aliivibrio fischeri]OCH11349.1 KTSC domain-containing protein [Aliivibrio fischeri]OED54111.1 KTSC domain-containing protein [Aliivibrio fischeri]
MTEWVSVSSTAIRRIGYDAESMRMYIDFKDSDPVYTFCRVPENVFREFISARSVGRYYHQYIKDRYDC